MADPQAAAVYQHYQLPVPERERTAKVYIRARDLQPEVLEGYADVLAEFFATAAMAQGVTRAELHFPNRQVVTLDLDEVKRQTARELGFWPQPTAISAKVAIMNLRRMGAEFEPAVTQVPVPAAITGVSGNPGAEGE